MGLCLEKNVESLIDFQAKISGASKDFTQLPMMNGLMMHYVDQSSQVLAEIQEKMQQQFNSQAEQMMDAMRLKHR